MPSGLQAITYLNLQHLPQTQPQFQRPTGLVICIFLIHLYQPRYASWFQTCIGRALCIWSNQVQAYVLVRPGGHWSTTRRPSPFSSFWLFWRQSWRLHKEEVLAASNRAFIHTAIKGCSRVICSHASTSGWSTRRSTTWIIRTSVCRSTLPRTYVLSEEATYHKPVAPPI